MNEASSVLLRSEKKRLRLIVLGGTIPAFLPVAYVLIVQDEYHISGIIGFFLGGCVLFYYAVKAIYRKIKVLCPNCNAPVEGDYSRSNRGSDKNVQHSCRACGQRYIDGVLQKS